MADPAQARAALYLDRVNLEIVKATATRRQHHAARAPGARLPASIAGPRVALEVIAERTPEGERQVTPLGYKTARRALPPILAGLAPTDPRRRVALLLADSFERVGASAGAQLEGAHGGHSGAAPDGGVTTKIKHAARLARLEALANGWAISPTGKIERKAPRILLKVQRQTGRRQQIKAFEALTALAVEGVGLAEVLRRAGWEVRARNRRALAEAVLELLSEIAVGLGLGPRPS